MTFRPSVVPIRRPDFFDTFGRAVERGFGFVEDVREARREQGRFQSEQRLTELRSQALEQAMGMEARGEVRGALTDPQFRRQPPPTAGPRVSQLPPGAPDPSIGLFEDPTIPGQVGGQPGGQPAPGGQPRNLELTELPDRPGVFGEAGAPLLLDPVTVEAPAEPEGTPPAQPAPVSEALAQALSPEGGLTNLAPRQQAPEPAFTLPGGQDFFFDPQGAQREGFAAASFAGQQIRTNLERAATAAANNGQQAVAERIRDRIETGVARIESGELPAQVVQEIMQDARTGERLAGEEQFLRGQVGELGGVPPSGLEVLTPEGRISELVGTRERLMQRVDQLEMVRDQANELGDVTERERIDVQITAQIINAFNSTTKNLRDSAEGFGRMRSNFAGVLAGEPAAQVAMLMAYGKVLDPGSVVRESEMRNLQNIGSVDDRIRNAIERAKTGSMDEGLARSIMGQAEAIMIESARSFEVYRDAALDRAELQGLDRNRFGLFVPDPFDRFFEPDTPEGEAEVIRRLTEGT